MKQYLYTVFDKVSGEEGEYIPPIPFPSKGEAKRWFETKIKNEPLFRDNKSDFELWTCGEFDTEKGILTGGTFLELKGDSINV